MAKNLVPKKKAEEISYHLEDYINHNGIEDSLRQWMDTHGINSKSELPVQSQSFRGRVFKFYNEEWRRGGFIKQKDVREFIENKIELDLIDSQVQKHFGESKEELDIGQWTARAARTITLEICLLVIEKKILR
jgi:hypothetical protein